MMINNVLVSYVYYVYYVGLGGPDNEGGPRWSERGRSEVEKGGVVADEGHRLII